MPMVPSRVLMSLAMILLQDKHKSSICKQFVPNHYREFCQPFSGSNCFQRVRVVDFTICDVHIFKLVRL